jgi:hypothetical protein
MHIFISYASSYDKSLSGTSAQNNMANAWSSAFSADAKSGVNKRTRTQHTMFITFRFKNCRSGKNYKSGL